jgi:peptidoglycan L-alanyl-D-glutamate endopeptidase CwlK
MPKIVGKSLEKLLTVDPRLQAVMHAACEVMDFTVVCGARGQAEQDQAFAEGKSKAKYPNSKHNVLPGQQYSRAVDIVPFFPDGIDWKDSLAFARLAGVVLTMAHAQGVRVRWGGDWDRDGRSADETFRDLPHFELED